MAVWSRLADADADVEAEEAGQHHIGKVARHKRDLKRAASTNVVAKLCLFFIQVRGAPLKLSAISGHWWVSNRMTK